MTDPRIERAVQAQREEFRELFQQCIAVQGGTKVPAPRIIQSQPQNPNPLVGFQVLQSSSGDVVGGKTESLGLLVLNPKMLLKNWFATVPAGVAYYAEPNLATLTALVGGIWLFSKNRHIEVSPDAARYVAAFWHASDGGHRSVSEERVLHSHSTLFEDIQTNLDEIAKTTNSLTELGLLKMQDGKLDMTERVVFKEVL